MRDLTMQHDPNPDVAEPPYPPYLESSARGRPAPSTSPSQDAIAMRAYEIYVNNGRPAGRCKEHWEQAERELQEEARAAEEMPEMESAYEEETRVVSHDEPPREVEVFESHWAALINNRLVHGGSAGRDSKGGYDYRF